MNELASGSKLPTSVGSGVAVELVSASINGAIMNIKINLNAIENKKYKIKINNKIDKISSLNDTILFELNKNISI